LRLHRKAVFTAILQKSLSQKVGYNKECMG
jgi:hypothetical protein